MVVLFHSDFDGQCAAYWVANKYNCTNLEDFIEMDYGINIDWYSRIKPDEKVFIVDFSIEPDEMRKLLKKTKDVTWIDHHVSAINKYKDFDFDIKGIRYDGIAGCMLTYIYLFPMKEGREVFDPNLGSTAPWFTKYIADYDVWKYEYGDETAHFILGLDTCGNIHPLNPIWNELENIDKVRSLIEDGKVCEKYRACLAERAVKSSAFEYDIQGIKTLCMNNNEGFSNSTWFGNKIKEYDMICAFSYDGKIWHYSLYADKEKIKKKGIDCSKVAESIPNKLSGGGHKGAAGFQTKEFIFK